MRTPSADDVLRTLDDLGREQAGLVSRLLVDAGVKRLLTSPAVRCRQTLEPLGIELGLELEDTPSLSEGQGSTAAVSLMRTLVREGATAALCSHGDLIPDIIQTFARDGMTIVGPRGWAKGSTWRLDTQGADVVQARFLGPF